MAAKKKVSSKKAVNTAKKAGKKVVRKAKTLLGAVAQKSAQLILDSGILGDAPKAPAKKKAKASKKKAKVAKKRAKA